MIEVMITATKRPEILDRTLRSFKQNLFRNWPIRVIINVDPVGPGTTDDVLEIVGEYFKIKTVNLPERAHFGRAFKWTWSQVEGDLAFMLEDDWELLRPISFTYMMDLMFEVQDLATLRLPWRPTGRVSMKNWKFYFPWIPVGKGGFFECPRRDRQEVGFCGHPSLIRGSFIKKCAPLLDPKKNPEKQFHGGNGPLVREVLKWRYGIYSRQNQPEAIRDIGREWMIKAGFRKEGSKAFFTKWRQAREGE